MSDEQGKLGKITELRQIGESWTKPSPDKRYQWRYTITEHVACGKSIFREILKRTTEKVPCEH